MKKPRTHTPRSLKQVFVILAALLAIQAPGCEPREDVSEVTNSQQFRSYGALFQVQHRDGIFRGADGGVSDLSHVNDTSHLSPDGHASAAPDGEPATPPETDNEGQGVGSGSPDRGDVSRLKAEPAAVFDPELPRGKVTIPTKIFSAKGSRLDRAVLRSNPRLFVPTEHDGASRPILIVGMPGWGGRSENFIMSLANGLKDPALRRRLVVATIQDTRNGGPRFQGQSNRANANTYLLRGDAVKVMDHFISRVCEDVFGGPGEVYLLGFSTGGVAAPDMASRLSPGHRYRVAGAVSIGAGTSASAARLLKKGQRVLFTVAPKMRDGDKPLKADRSNRLNAEYSHLRLRRAGVESYLLHIASARQHRDWHWGLLSQCRYPNKRANGGRGYYPHYWMPNPDTMGAISTFLLGGAPVLLPATPTACP